ncbi:carbohydrate kinase family protein [Nioella nitratireducens]|uniref:carbohydrate kinase family protein n=1 Tax=Nioella nitratireducens TaxID=1287720 RepID=UPI0008FD744D|nr:carbohydrate kinase [Nioella nitratireducens]
MILCCGEALIDMIPKPTVEGGQEGFVPHSGGAVFNTAIALGRLGTQVGMVTGLSSDMFGQQLTSALQASHVDTSRVIRSDRPTTLAFVKLTDGHATYFFFDENTAGRLIAPDDLPSLSGDVSALFFGGISLAVDPCADTYATLLDREGASRAVMLDPNIRPGFIKDVDRYRARLAAMLAGTDIVKVSDEDLNWIFPGPESLADKLDQMRATGPKVVLLTRGGEGATGYLADGRAVAVAAPKVQTVDTVGAGDTFNAGVLASLSEQGCLTKDGIAALTEPQIRAALDLAARAAAVTVTRAGANPPWREEI